ncbi:LAQU0S02e08878g1_1 [Lachancea quebecensis]|uniref:LAQU0S02e08878g1_1 n=1 Tax=Lachancea quebecensis TaxID=1654605 RepID=A0A0N7ML41_9SACH|nr:LAQU0S02e08878g1_1 [Lachancea quebecensis]
MKLAGPGSPLVTSDKCAKGREGTSVSVLAGVLPETHGRVGMGMGMGVSIGTGASLCAGVGAGAPASRLPSRDQSMQKRRGPVSCAQAEAAWSIHAQLPYPYRNHTDCHVAPQSSCPMSLPTSACHHPIIGVIIYAYHIVANLWCYQRLRGQGRT